MMTEFSLLGEILNKKVIYTPLCYNNVLGAPWSPFFYPTCYIWTPCAWFAGEKKWFSPHAELYVAEIICFWSLYGIFKMSFEMERWCAVWKDNSWVAFSLLVFWVQCTYLHNAKINQAIKAKALQGFEVVFIYYYYYCLKVLPCMWQKKSISLPSWKV